ncbi:methylenetetrahydrofolate reductase [NAD(P)H] [bacterium]|nr:methylenetetrahydrofolate reductase [NAD(P)H] [bacterium]
MKLREIYAENGNDCNEKEINKRFIKKPTVSFEVFPPKNDVDGEKVEKLIKNLEILKKYNPAFISLTYGAGGTTRENSIEIIKRIQKELKLNIMPHFTCVATKKNHVEEYLKEIQALGIENILALRGDIPEGLNDSDFDFHHANEIVKFIHSKTNLSIGVAGYPEGHISCNNFDLDMKYLKQKVDSGADVIFTQMFFDNEKFFAFRDYAKKIGIKNPIIAGLLPVKSFTQLEKMLSMGRVTLPKKFAEILEKHKDNPDDIRKIGIDFTTQQAQQLVDNEVSGLHFYTLNSSKSICEILDNFYM